MMERQCPAPDPVLCYQELPSTLHLVHRYVERRSKEKDNFFMQTKSDTTIANALVLKEGVSLM